MASLAHGLAVAVDDYFRIRAMPLMPHGDVMHPQPT